MRRVTCRWVAWWAVLGLGLGACGSAGTTEAHGASDVRTAPAGPVGPFEPAAAGPNACVTDTDCLVGTQPGCCIQHCADETVAWNVSAWRAFQDQCAVVECDVVERVDCPPRDTPLPRPEAACVAGVCTLVRR